MKPLLPSLREKKRYIVFKTSQNITNKEVTNKIKEFIGELGLAESGTMIIKNKNNKLILKTNPKYTDKIKIALALSKKPVLNPILTTGSIKKTSEVKI